MYKFWQNYTNMIFFFNFTKERICIQYMYTPNENYCNQKLGFPHKN